MVTSTTTTPLELGGYRCDTPLGAGFCGASYRALHEPTGVVRLVKLLYGELDSGEQGGTLDTLQLCKRLEHPNVLRVREVGDHNGRPYTVRDYIDGINLRQLLSGRKEGRGLSVLVASHLVWQVTRGLDYAHRLRVAGQRRPLAHGALWPENVLLTWRGDVVLSDFGSWELSSRGRLSALTSRCAYQSPEHFGDQKVDVHSDVFSAGVLLYELLTGRSLFGSDVVSESIRRVQEVDLGTLSDVQPELRPVVFRCLQRRPEDRYADIVALSAQLVLALPGLSSPHARAQLAAVICDTASRPSEAVNVHPRGSMGVVLPSPEHAAAGGADEPTDVTPPALAEALCDLSRDNASDVVVALRRLGTSTDAEEATDPGRDNQAEPTLSTTASFSGDPQQSPVRELEDAGARTLVDEPTATIPTSPRAELASTDAGSALEDAQTEQFDGEGHGPSDALAADAVKPSNSNAARLPISWLPPSAEDKHVNQAPRQAKDPALAALNPPSRRSEDPMPATTQREHVRGPAVPSAEIPTDLNTIDLRGPAAREKLEMMQARASAEGDRGSAGRGARQVSKPRRTKGPRRRHLTPAHALLVVAFLVFVFSVALLARRFQWLQGSPSVVVAAPDLGAVASHPVDQSSVGDAVAGERRGASGAALASASAAVPVESSPNERAAKAADARFVDGGATEGDRDGSEGGEARPSEGPRLAPGVLEVTALPRATVFVAGVKKGRTPVTIRGEAGSTVDIVVMAPRRAVHTERVVLPVDRGLALDVTLPRAGYALYRGRRRGVLRVRCRRRDRRRIFINGEDTGVSCPKAHFFLRPGLYRVGLLDPRDGQTVNFRVRIRPRRRPLLRPKLPPHDRRRLKARRRK